MKIFTSTPRCTRCTVNRDPVHHQHTVYSVYCATYHMEKVVVAVEGVVVVVGVVVVGQTIHCLP